MKNILFVLFMSGIILSAQTLKISNYQHLQESFNGTRGDRKFPGNFSQGNKRRPPPPDFNGTFPERPEWQNGTRPFPPNFNGTFPDGEQGKFRPMGQRPNTFSSNQAPSHYLQTPDLPAKNNEADSRQPKKGDSTNRERNDANINLDNKDQPKRKAADQSNHMLAGVPQNNLDNPNENEQFNWSNDRVQKQKNDKPKSQERERRDTNPLDTNANPNPNQNANQNQNQNPNPNPQDLQKSFHLRSRQYSQDEGRRRGQYPSQPEYDMAPRFRDFDERQENFERSSFNKKQYRNSRRQFDNDFEDSFEPRQRREPLRLRDFDEERPQRRNQRFGDSETFGRRDFDQRNSFERVHYETIENPAIRPRIEGNLQRNGGEGGRLFMGKENRNEFN